MEIFLILSKNFLYITLHWTFSISCHNQTPSATFILCAQLSSDETFESIMEKLKTHTCFIYFLFSLSQLPDYPYCMQKYSILSLSYPYSWRSYAFYLKQMKLLFFKYHAECVLIEIVCGGIYWNSIRENGKWEKIPIHLLLLLREARIQKYCYCVIAKSQLLCCSSVTKIPKYWLKLIVDSSVGCSKFIHEIEIVH